MNQQNNQAMRELLTLPPLCPGASTALAAPELPPQQIVTGHLELDAVLWLQKVVATGNQALIDKALQAAEKIKTPMKELGQLYANHMARATGNTFGAALSSFGFGNLKDQARRAIDRANRRHEALSRFGDEKTLFAATPAEKACKAAMRGLKKKEWPYYNEDLAAGRFAKHAALRPHTLDDCLYARNYWDSLYSLRSAWENSGDHWPQVQAHDNFCFAQMANIRSRSHQESLRTFEHLREEDGSLVDRRETPAIVSNLISSGWSCPWIFSQDAQPDPGIKVIVLDAPEGHPADVTVAARTEESDWTGPEAAFWWMPIPPLVNEGGQA